MDFFEALEWSNWKNLSQELRTQVMNQVLMYFVSPLKYVSDVEYKEFELAGVKCKTFECSIDGERFVLVPGNKEAILGWNFGTQGLPITCWDQEPNEENLYFEELRKNYQFITTEDWDFFVNESTSSLRKVAISPMLVQKTALPAGARAIGELNAVTGEFTGIVEDFLPIEQAIRTYFKQGTSLLDSLTFQLPSELYEENQFYAKLNLADETYQVYHHESCTFETLKTAVNQQVFDLLSEDEWEYVVGAGTRKLFRWGNDLEQGENYQGRQVARKIKQENMFGLVIDHSRRFWELTDSGFLKLEKMEATGIPLFDWMPLSSYYRSRKILIKEKKLHPADYAYRKVIVISRD
ncbi:MAG: hypothetical protein GX180_00400 [Enterococcus sp.]|nr:hypothetical protein [Enterococcus sp.]